jgi:hypothetical protein
MSGCSTGQRVEPTPRTDQADHRSMQGDAEPLESLLTLENLYHPFEEARQSTRGHELPIPGAERCEPSPRSALGAHVRYELGRMQDGERCGRARHTVGTGHGSTLMTSDPQRWERPLRRTPIERRP